MKEILTLQVGNAGNMIGQSFWDLMVNEHDINSNPQNTQMLFQEYKQGYFARNLMIDMDPNSIDKILASNSPIYNPDNTINLKHGCSNIYAEGYKFFFLIYSIYLTINESFIQLLFANHLNTRPCVKQISCCQNIL